MATTTTADIDRPEWLNESFLAQVYVDEQPSPSSLEILKCSSVVGMGDNYLSNMFRLTVKVNSAEGAAREDSLVVKSLEHTDKTMKEMGIFQIESEMYKSVLKALQGYWSELGQDVQFGPKCLVSVSQPFDVLVLSDLKVGGYAMADRFERLSLEHAKLTLSKLAKFHAAGLLYKEREGAPPKVTQRKYVDKVFGGVMAQLLPGTLSSLEQRMKDIGMGQFYADKMSKWQESLLPSIVRATDPDYYPADFQTILHGDLWLNNELFKYDDQQKPIDVQFVDFQLSSYGNPMFDFVYFVFTSVKPEIVVEQLDALLAFYHTELTAAMGALKVQTQVPSLDQLNLQLQRAGPFVSNLLLFIIPIILMDRMDVENKNSLMTSANAEVMAKLNDFKFSNPRFEEHLKVYLPFWDKRGFLSSHGTKEDLPDYLKGIFDGPSEAVVVVAAEEKPATPVESEEAARPVPAPRTNSNELQLPSWLTVEFIKEFRPTAGEITIKKCSSVVEVGDNYCAQLYRLDVDVKEGDGEAKEESFVIKSSSEINPMLKSLGIVENEKEVYVDVLPEFNKMWQGIGQPVDFAPKCFKATEVPHDIMVLDDLNKSGFKMCNRFEKLDLDHALLTLSKLAKLHASSVVFKEKIGYGKRMSRKPFPEDLITQFHHLSLAKTNHVLAVIKTLNFGSEIVAECEKWLVADPLELIKITDPSLVGFPSFVHGDCWMNNILFKYNSNGQVEDVQFIDFQMSYEGNGLIDVLYLLCSSLRANILVEKFDELFKHYFERLVEACQLLGVGEKAPTFAQLSEQLEFCAHFAPLNLIEVVPVVVMERHADANIAAFLGDPNSAAAKNLADKMFWNPRYVDILQNLVPFFYKKGWLVAKKQVIETTPVQETAKDVPVVQVVVVEEVKKEEVVIVAEELKVQEVEVIAEQVVVNAVPVEEKQESLPVPVVPAENSEEIKEITPAAEIKEEMSVPVVPSVVAEETKEISPAVEIKEEIVPVIPAVAVEEKPEPIVEVAKEQPTSPTSPTVVIEPWPSTKQEVKPKRLLKARIEETINKFAALEANGHSKFKPEARGADFPSGYPKWLDKFYFLDLLRKDYSSVKIFKFSVGPANGKGENYASQMYRVKLSLETNQAGLVNRNFMVKVNHDSGPAAEMMQLINFFPKEIEMYTSFYPKFESMYKAVGETVRLGAKCVLGTRDPADLIVLEDLSLEGYKTADRFNGLDLDHVHLTISKLAKMHAASVAYLDQGGKFDAKFDEGIYSPKMIPIFESLMQGNIDIMRNVSKDWKCARTMGQYLDNWSEIFLKKTFPIAQRDDSRFNVLCHGDLWCNNIMFKYNSEGKVQDALLVDLQICNYNSPMLDLHYFIFSSLHSSLRISKIDYIIAFYHAELSANMKKLGTQTKVPSLLQLQKDFLATGLFGVGTAFGTFPIAVAPPSPDSDMNSFISDTEASRSFKERLYSNPIFKNAIEELVPYFERKGYFEV